MSDRALGCRRTPSHAPAIPPHRGSPPAASRPGDCPHTGRSGTLPARDPDGVERIMGDDSMCVRQARTDVLGHQIRIVRKDPLHGLSLRQEAQDEFYRYPHPAENRLPAKDFRVGRNSLQEFFLCRWTIPFPLNSSPGHGEEHGVQEALLPTIFRVHGREGVGQSQEAPPAPMLRRKPLLLSVSPPHHLPRINDKLVPPERPFLAGRVSGAPRPCTRGPSSPTRPSGPRPCTRHSRLDAPRIRMCPPWNRRSPSPSSPPRTPLSWSILTTGIARS